MRLVDIDLLPKGFIGGGEFVEGIKYVYEMLKQFQPVDAVVVVRCKDCKYWHHGYCCGVPLVGDDASYVATEKTDYCSYGEAKMDGKGEGE